MENKIVEKCNRVGTYYIFQMKEEKKDLQFFSRERVEEMAGPISASWYNIMYAGRMTGETTLDGLYVQFNINRPEDFKGHSLSVSDVIVLVMGDYVSCYYVDDVGFAYLTDFFTEMDSGIMDFEYAFRNGDHMLHFQTVSDGYDYSFYDAQGKIVDGGIYDDTDCPYIIALCNVMDDMSGLLGGVCGTENNFSYLDTEELPL